MNAFWTTNLDYVFVLYGAAFLTMGVMAGALRAQDPKGRLVWPWLQAFGILHGLHEWAEGLVANLGETPLVSGALKGALTLSFLLLLEFARRRTGTPPRRRLWVTGAGLGAALACGWAGFPDGIRYLIGLPAALWTAHGLWNEPAADAAEQRWLRRCSILMIGYGLLAGLVTPGPGWLPGLNYASFAGWAGAPVQVYRALLMVGLALGLWRLALLRLEQVTRSSHGAGAPRQVRSHLFLLMAVLALGFLVTHHLGRRASEEVRTHLLSRVKAVAASLNADMLMSLTGDPAQEMTRPHQQVVRALTEVRRMSSDIAQIYLYAREGTNFIFYACSMTERPEDYYPAGEVYEGEMEPVDLEFFDTGIPYVAGPYRDRWGEWVSAYAPALWANNGEVKLGLGMDLPADAYQHSIRLYRTLGLLLTMGLTLLVLDFFARQRRFWLITQHLAASEADLRKLSTHLESRVEERTNELATANAALQKEVLAHRVAELKLRTLTDQLPVITYSVTLQPRPHTTFISPQVQTLLGYKREEWMQHPDFWESTLHPDDRERVVREVARANRTGEDFDLECRQVARDGTVRWFRNTARFQFDAQGHPLQVHGVMLDVTDRIQAADLVRETAERYRLLFEQSPVGVFHYDRNCVVTKCNARLATILRRPERELVGSNLHTLGDEALVQAVQEALEGRLGSCEGVYQATPSSGTIWISLRTAPVLDHQGRPAGGVAIVEDIGERRRLEEERLKSQKLESLGLLAGGIAHDFNNILTSILGNISMLRLSGELLDSDSQHILAEAEGAAKRAKDLTHQLLTFAKGGAPVKKLTRVDDLLRETVSFAMRGSASRFEVQVDNPLWAADVDAGQITQVVQNLVINADQAMPGGGSLVVRAGNIHLQDQEQPGLPAGAYLRIDVQDTGIGIPAQHLERIFDPYFTTKSKGSGLGLTTSFSIVHKHGGRLVVASEVGKGSVFTLFLPAREGVVLPRHDGAPGTAAVLPAEGRILVMDDEPAIRDLTRRMLQRHGFEVITTAHGEETLAAYRQALTEGKPYRVVILDLTIPGGLGGRETFLRLKTLDPSICALVASGYSDQTLAETLALGFIGVVPKPFTAAELWQAVQQALARLPSGKT